TAERTEFARLGALVVFGFVGVVVPVVALFVGGDDAVAAYGTAHGPGEVEVLELEPVVGLAPVTFGLEHDNLVDFTVFQAQLHFHLGAAGTRFDAVAIGG